MVQIPPLSWKSRRNAWETAIWKEKMRLLASCCSTCVQNTSTVDYWVYRSVENVKGWRRDKTTLTDVKGCILEKTTLTNVKGCIQEKTTLTDEKGWH